MRKKYFRSIDEVLCSGILHSVPSADRKGSDRVLTSTRIEDKIYNELREDDTEMDILEMTGGEKLPSFPALARDIYQSFYSLNVRRTDDDKLSETAKIINSHIISEVMGDAEYPSIKASCEGRQLPAYDAAAEFAEKVTEGLDDLLNAATGDKNALNTLNKAVQREERLAQELSELLTRRDDAAPSPELDRKIVDKANRLESKAEQIQAISQQIRDNLMANKETVSLFIAGAATAAKEKAEETSLLMAAWSQGDSSDPKRMKLDIEAMNKVRSSETLLKVSKHLGRFKEMLAKARKNSYAYGRGEKYTLEYGKDLQRVLTSEFSMLAMPETIPLFLRKYQSGKLKQYKRREHIFKGLGDIIMCLDESSSTEEEAPWGKAVALALLDAAMKGGRKFALIHFSDAGRFKTDVFLPGAFDNGDVFTAAETFLDGCTDFETPINEALRLMREDGFEQADIVFTTDGYCSLSSEFVEEITVEQAARGFTITGVLLDITSPGMEFSLSQFCNDIFRTSEMAGDDIVMSLLSARI